MGILGLFADEATGNSESLSHLPEVTQLLIAGVGIEAQFS